MIMRKTFLALMAASLLSALLLPGCGGEAPKETASLPGHKSVAPAKKPVVPQEEAAEKKEEAPPEYAYDPVGRRDPFAALTEVRRPVIETEDVPMTPLQNYDLERLRLGGVIVGMKVPKAMLLAPDGKSYIVRPGTRVGKNHGTVVKITRDAVLVEELYYDFSGEIRKNIQAIELPKKEGVK